MIQEITYHGKISDNIEYFATVAGSSLVQRYFFEPSANGTQDRFFFAGKELILNESGITHKGDGGSVCKYMFGVEQPLKDLVRKDVLNRLAIYGALFDEENGRLTFTEHKDGFLSYEKIFLEGNALSNYYFFLHLSNSQGSSSEQERVLRYAGKTMKRSAFVARSDDRAVVSELFACLSEFQPMIFLFRIVSCYNQTYYELFRQLYSVNKEITDEGEAQLVSLAERLNIDHYQQERIKIDVIYNYPDNKRVLDDYKDLLISLEKNDEIDPSDINSLNRLRSLAIRNKIPPSLFDLLDELLIKDKKHMILGEEPDYITESRALLDGLFITEGGLGAVLSRNDLLRLLNDKKKSLENRDLAFDSLLLDIGKACDEGFQKGNYGAMERFSELITYFDRFDTTSSMINRMAFMDEDIPVEMLRSILGHMRAFEEIQKGSFHSFFIADLLNNKYLTVSGRRKILALYEGLEDVEKGYKSLADVAKSISNINHEDRLYQQIYKTAMERLRMIPGVAQGKTEADRHLKVVLKGILHEGKITNIPKVIMKKVFVAIKMEIFYINDVLPEVVISGNVKLREDFFHNSGFDRFYIEDIERKYLEQTHQSVETIQKFREMTEQV